MRIKNWTSKYHGKKCKKKKNNPYSFLAVKKKIGQDLSYFKKRIKITKVPEIVEICYGRKVGYKVKKINLSSNIEKISATSIRNKLRKKNKNSFKMSKSKSTCQYIMNCHNGEKFLTESLKSVKNQTYKNWELIFYDNCSTDKSKI